MPQLTFFIVTETTQPNNFSIMTAPLFTTPLINGHLHAIAGANGVFGPISTFPNQSYDSSKYLRYLVLVPGRRTGDTVSPTVAITPPTAGATVSGMVTNTATSRDHVCIAG